MFPSVSAAIESLIVAPIGEVNASEKLAFTALQGLVNRESPQLYLVREMTETDAQYQFLKIIVKRGVGWESRDNPWNLFGEFREAVRGVVIYDPRLVASVDIAVAMAAKEGLIPVTAALAARLKEQFAFSIVADLRDRWRSETEAHTWAYTELWPKFRRDLFAFLMYAGEVKIPDKLPLTSWSSYAYETADYLIQHEIFPYTMLIKTIEGDFRQAIPPLTMAASTEEIEICEKYLADLSTNIPALTGFNIPFGEHHAVGLLSAYGIFSVATPGPNLSVHTATAFGDEKPLLQAARRVNAANAEQVAADKVYLTFILSDGDNLGTYPVKLAKQWRDPKRGEVPLAWSLSPLAMRLMPAVTRYFYETATPNDYHVAACSGLGYTKPTRYGERLGAKRETVYREYLQLTARYMQNLDMQEVWPINTDPTTRKLYAEGIPGVKGVFADFTPAAAYAESIERVGDVPIFRCLVGPWGTETPGDNSFQDTSWIVEEIRRKTLR